MKISGFTMVRNATKYYFPIKESIESILPIVDEFVIALGDCDPDDRTRQEIEAIDSDKIKIIERVWSEEDFVESRVFALETTFALEQCTGDWCFYLQADEVIHEDDLPKIKKACEDNLDKPNLDGLLFNYNHFFGDYDHYLPVHGWYKNEIRVVRNNKGVYSYKDAQSFRKNNNEKLNVVPIDARVFHYGWVRPPHVMQSKKKEHESIHNGKDSANKSYALKAHEFNYGAIGRIPVFKGTHPKVMDEFRTRFNWKNKLNYTKNTDITRKKMKHERLKYRVVTFLENTLNGGRDFIGYSNWNKI